MRHGFAFPLECHSTPQSKTTAPTTYIIPRKYTLLPVVTGA